jgi:hypothetical protein
MKKNPIKLQKNFQKIEKCVQNEKYCQHGGAKLRYTRKIVQIKFIRQPMATVVIGAKSDQHSTVSCRLVKKKLWNSKKKMCAPLVA